MRWWSPLLLPLLSPWLTAHAGNELSACNTTQDCVESEGKGSLCRRRDDDDGQCSNPVEQGCLYGRLEGWTLKRVCNSDDPPNAADRGLCRTPDFDYMEIRISANNWESAFIEAWVLQVILSELLGVPTTLESGSVEAKVNFYDPKNSIDYGPLNFLPMLGNAQRRAAELIDCRLAVREPFGGNYETCLHVIPEGWDMELPYVKDLIREGIIEPARGLGVLGHESWFVPKFAAEKDPSLLSYLGLRGEENRQRLADLFLRPTTWKDYCAQVSSTACRTPDAVAQRAPADEAEEQRMFVEGLYTGHFRKTAENDCTNNATTNCTGAIADYPCGWSSFLKQQAYHLNIAVQSSGDEPYSRGYTYPQLVEMWHAANATKSPILMAWWSPDATYHKFLGTEAEMLRVALPPATRACIEARVDPHARCDPPVVGPNGADSWYGEAAGACDYPPIPLQMQLSSALADSTFDPSIPEAGVSPAYEAIRRFRIDDIQIFDMLDYWISHKSPRDGICEWAIQNMELLREFIPRRFPRVKRFGEEQDSPLFVAATSLGALATLMTVITAFFVHRYRKERAIRFAQIEFLWLLLVGLLLISVGSILTAMPPTNGSCIASIWLISLGYTCELVPLIVKIAAINRLVHAARRLQRVKLSRQSLFGVVALIGVLVAAFCACWTTIDPPGREPSYTLTDSITDSGETVVMVSYVCTSKSQAWTLAAISWTALLLVTASVIAFQTRNLRQEFNESQTLAMIIYSHFVFVVLRGITFFLHDSALNEATLARCRSLIYSVDSISTIIFYFANKLYAVWKGGANGRTGSDRGGLRRTTSVEEERASAAMVAQWMLVENDKPCTQHCVSAPQLMKRLGASEVFASRASTANLNRGTRSGAESSADLSSSFHNPVGFTVCNGLRKEESPQRQSQEHVPEISSPSSAKVKSADKATQTAPHDGDDAPRQSPETSVAVAERDIDIKHWMEEHFRVPTAEDVAAAPAHVGPGTSGEHQGEASSSSRRRKSI